MMAGNGSGYGGYSNYGGNANTVNATATATANPGGFGGYPGAGGGGFMNSPNPAADSPRGGAAESPRGANSKSSATIPICVRQIHAATIPVPDNGLKFENVDLSGVSIVGRISKSNEQSTKTTFTVDDGTGVIDVVLWFNEDSKYTAERRAKCSVGTYVRAIGVPKLMQGKRFIQAHDVRPIADPNEITFHFLETVYTHLQKTRAPPRQAVGVDPRVSAYSSGAYGPQDTGNSAHMGDFTALQQRVTVCLKQADGIADGMSVKQLIVSLKGYASEPEIRGTLDWLVTEGHIYSTLDDEHYRAATCTHNSLVQS